MPPSKPSLSPARVCAMARGIGLGSRGVKGWDLGSRDLIAKEGLRHGEGSLTPRGISSKALWVAVAHFDALVLALVHLQEASRRVNSLGSSCNAALDACDATNTTLVRSQAKGWRRRQGRGRAGRGDDLEQRGHVRSSRVRTADESPGPNDSVFVVGLLRLRQSLPLFDQELLLFCSVKPRR